MRTFKFFIKSCQTVRPSFFEMFRNVSNAVCFNYLELIRDKKMFDFQKGWRDRERAEK